MTDPERITRRWLTDCVLALELCPFAGPVVRDESLRIAVSNAAEPETQLQDFLQELDLIQGSSEEAISTTLLVLAQGPAEFEDFLDLIENAQSLLERAGLEGVVQLAHFHPHYLFAGEPEDGLSHFTNRAPLPTLHLIRESMMSRVLESFPNPEAIPARNIARLDEMGRAAVEQRWQALHQD